MLPFRNGCKTQDFSLPQEKKRSWPDPKAPEPRNRSVLPQWHQEATAGDTTALQSSQRGTEGQGLAQGPLCGQGTAISQSLAPSPEPASEAGFQGKKPAELNTCWSHPEALMFHAPLPRQGGSRPAAAWGQPARPGTSWASETPSHRASWGKQGGVAAEPHSTHQILFISLKMSVDSTDTNWPGPSLPGSLPNPTHTPPSISYSSLHRGPHLHYADTLFSCSTAKSLSTTAKLEQYN